jgi:hypothetical protein
VVRELHARSSGTISQVQSLVERLIDGPCQRLSVAGGVPIGAPHCAYAHIVTLSDASLKKWGGSLHRIRLCLIERYRITTGVANEQY